MKKERIALYGGTFSPPHIGHVLAAEAFFRAVQPDRLLIVPSATPPHKPPVGGASVRDRLAMCRLAFGKIDRVEISDIEIERKGKSYTVDTLRVLAREDRELSILIGTDMLLTLDTWKCPSEIMSLAAIYVARREKDPVLLEKLRQKAEQFREKYGAHIEFLDVNATVISSTELRARIAAGEPINEYLTETVEAYITQWDLYRD